MRQEAERLARRESTIDDVASPYGLESIPEVGQEIVWGQGESPRRHVELAVLLDGLFLGRVGSWSETRSCPRRGGGATRRRQCGG